MHAADRVCAALLRESQGLVASSLMLVGAHCRDVLQASHGHDFPIRATDDVDVGIALADWDAYERLTSCLTPSGETGIQFHVQGVRTDLLPFGTVERPTGTVTPQARAEPLSVWGFTEAFERADSLRLPTAGLIRIPTVPGYLALKLAAWLDRSAYGQYKDAGDIAAAMYWYVESESVCDRLYSEDTGIEVLVAHEMDQSLAAIHLLGSDAADLLGPDRTDELRLRWPGPQGDLLPLEMDLSTPGWPAATLDRRDRLGALEAGLGLTRDT